MIFKISILLIQLGNLITCTYDLIVLTKTKEMTHYYESRTFGGKALPTIISNKLTQVNVPAKKWIKHALSGPALSYPLILLVDQYSRAHSCP
jgi:hypothetical protein